MNVLAYVLQILAALPQLLAAGVEISAFVQKARDDVERMKDEGRDPTPQEWDALNAEIARLRAQLHDGPDS